MALKSILLPSVNTELDKSTNLDLKRYKEQQYIVQSTNFESACLVQIPVQSLNGCVILVFSCVNLGLKIVPVFIELSVRIE